MVYKKIFSAQNLHMDTWNAIRTNLLSDKKLTFFRSSSKTIKKTKILIEKFSSKCSSGHVEWTIPSIEQNLIKDKKRLVQCPKTVKKQFFPDSNDSPQNVFYGHVDCGFDNPVEQVRRKAESFLLKVGKWSRDFLQKTTSPQKVPMVLPQQSFEDPIE